VIGRLDRDLLRREFNRPSPFRFVQIDGLLEPGPALEVAASLPGFESAREQGFSFDFVNERKKVQICDSARFPQPVHRLHEALASPEFLDLLGYVTGIPKLLADPTLAGGGIHVTGPAGRLDVHVDFNYDPARNFHRRLNLLLYLNPGWNPAWGGRVELWDRDVSRCWQSIEPLHNRCVIFETSEISFHGVTPLRCPPGAARKSFAAYYYTTEAPPDWDGREHSTIFRARPDEHFRRYVSMPAERLWRGAMRSLRRAKRRVAARVLRRR